MNNSDFSQELKLLLLSVLLSALSISDYLLKHSSPLEIPQAELKIPKFDLESEGVFEIFKAAKRSPAESITCPIQKADKKRLSLKC